MTKDIFPTNGIPFYKGKLICVTGASGLIGSYVVKLLKESGATVRAVVHTRSANEFTTMSDSIVTCDLLSAKHVNAVVKGCEVVLGCAGITGGIGLAHINPVSYVGPATAMAINTIHACAEEKVERFGYLSSTTVYAPSNWPVTEDLIDINSVVEVHPLYPLYRGIGQSKRFLEKLCAYYQEKTDLNIAIVRPSGAYGRFDNFDEQTSHVIPAMIERARSLGEGRSFEIWGDGQDARDFIHAQDVARCLLLATAHLSCTNPLNACSGKGTTTSELAKIILTIVGSKAELRFQPDKPSALRSRLVSGKKAIELIGFEPSIPLEAGLADTINWRNAQ